MTAIASIFNPLLQDNSEILAFYNDTRKNLGLELRDPSRSDEVAVNVAQPPKSGKSCSCGGGTTGGTTTGLIRNPSTMASFMYKNLARVYGITDADSKISLLSPGVIQLDATTESKYGSLAGCSVADGSNGWLFYLKGNPVQIVEYDLNTSTPREFPTDNILDNTNLTAFWDNYNGIRCFIYQSSDNNTLYLCQGGTDTGAKIPIKNTDAATANTTIAAACHLQKSKYYIYYTVAEDNSIRRITYEKTRFSDPHTLPQTAPPPDQYTNFSVTAGPDAIHLFYIYDTGESGKALYHYRDTDL